MIESSEFQESLMAFLCSVSDTLGALSERGLTLRSFCSLCGHVHDCAFAPLLKRHGRKTRNSPNGTHVPAINNI
jgi:hypothetical protein